MLAQACVCIELLQGGWGGGGGLTAVVHSVSPDEVIMRAHRRRGCIRARIEFTPAIGKTKSMYIVRDVNYTSYRRARQLG